MRTISVIGREAREEGAAPKRSTLARVAPILILFAIILAGFALRWDRLAYSEYSRDQAWVLNRAYDWLSKGDFPLVGIQSSLGTAQGAVEIYLLAIPVAISKDPLVANAFVGLLQMLAIVGTYLLASRYYGRRVGLVAAAFFVTNPWALQYARKVWTPNMAPIFTVLLFAAVYAAVIQRKRYYFSLALMLGVVLFLLHPSSIFYAPLLFIVAVLFWRRIGLRPLLLGGMLGLVVAAPYIWNEYLHRFLSVHLFLNAGTAPASVDPEALKNMVTMASARYYPTMMGYSFLGDWRLPDLTVQNDLATWLLYLGLALSVFYAGKRLLPKSAVSQGEWEKYLLMLLWFFVPVVVSLRHSMAFYPHYFINAVPVQYILMGIALVYPLQYATNAARRWRPNLTWLAPGAITAVVLFIGVSQAVYFWRYLDYVEQQETLGHYGVPLVYTQRAIDTIRELQSEVGPAPVYSYTDLQWEPLRYLGRPDLQINELDTREGLALPRDPSAGALFLLANDSIVFSDQKPFTPHDDGATVARLADLGFVELPDRAVRGPSGYAYYRFFYLSPEKASEELAALAKPAQLPLANQMRLRGYSLPRQAKAGGKIALAVLWDVPAGTGKPLDPEYNLSARLVDDKGEVVKNEDWQVIQYQDRVGRDNLAPWRAEDLPVAYYELQLPADLGPSPVWLDLTAHARSDAAATPWVDAGGKETGETVRLGPIEVLPAY
ncbi:MAG: ArnT family glycosyltransferase [Chloroflexota bacterium]